ncbi:MAG: glycoside hydrolase family 3 N-terminal domain-containing protein [Opitutaceae bacterium]
MRSSTAVRIEAIPSESAEFPFRNPALPRETRIEDLLSRLTVLEKINQLLHENNPLPHLGIPAYNWWSEACHGVGRNGRATVFPQVIGLAATWNRELILQVASAISDEARAKHHAALRAGRHGRNQGLTFWTPNINIFRDPRWGRGQETFGEDPYLTSELGVAMVQGLQGKDPRHLKVAACAKHFAVHSGPESERHEFDARPTEKDLAETYLPAFQRLVETGVEAVMGAYNRVRGEPACASNLLLKETLRGRWGFLGHVVSDCGAIDDFHRHHHVTSDAAASAALALRSGCDLNCGCTYNDLAVALADGLIIEEDLNSAVRRLLSTKFKLGIFDPPAFVRYASLPLEIVDCPAHRALARRAAVQSIVLLKNANAALPLRRDLTSVLVVGPTAANINAMLGNYAGISSRIVTFVEGIAERLDASSVLEYRPGCALTDCPSPALNPTLDAAALAEVVVAFVGLDPTVEGEEGDAVASQAGGDRAAIELPAVQREFIRDLRARAKKLILVVSGGSAVAIPEEHQMGDAVLYAWYPGCEGGTALADVLFGDVSPSGKLPVTVPRRTTDLPAFDDYRMRGRTYRFAEVEPLYPFGFGLSYANLHYRLLELPAANLPAGRSLALSAIVSNPGTRDVEEVVQCYVLPPRQNSDTARATLVDFRRIRVAAKSAVEIQFQVSSAAFHQVGADGKAAWVAGRYGVQIGSASPGPRAEALGSPAPVIATVNLI